MTATPTRPVSTDAPARAELVLLALILVAAVANLNLSADRVYTAGILAVLCGAALVFFCFPRPERERALLAQYRQEVRASLPG